MLGPINENTFFLIRSYLLDAGLQYKLVTTEVELGAALRQKSDRAHIENIGVAVEVQEQPIGGGAYSRLGTIQTGNLRRSVRAELSRPETGPILAHHRNLYDQCPHRQLV